jgi:hypothetical protein
MVSPENVSFELGLFVVSSMFNITWINNKITYDSILLRSLWPFLLHIPPMHRIRNKMVRSKYYWACNGFTKISLLWILRIVVMDLPAQAMLRANIRARVMPTYTTNYRADGALCSVHRHYLYNSGPPIPLEACYDFYIHHGNIIGPRDNVRVRSGVSWIQITSIPKA